MVLGAARLTTSQNKLLAFARSAVSQGISANETLRQWLAAGEKIRRQDAMAVYRYASGEAAAGFTVRSIRKDYFPTDKTLPFAHTNIDTAYSFNVRLNLVDNETGERFTRNITVATDVRSTIADIENQAHNAFYSELEHREDTNVSIDDTVIEEARRKNPIFG